MSFNPPGHVLGPNRNWAVNGRWSPATQQRIRSFDACGPKSLRNSASSAGGLLAPCVVLKLVTVNADGISDATAGTPTYQTRMQQHVPRVYHRPT